VVLVAASLVNTDPHNLRRFVTAQDRVYEDVLDELRAGRKRSHWMWFVFPQFAGLGHSAMASKYALSSAAEAQAYFADPVLGLRLKECTRLVLHVKNRRIEEILGHPDDLKFRSCMTLCNALLPDEPLYREALDRYFAGQADPRTLALLAA
jgi:uncharacterized protein (DUF1810 family)